MKKLLVVLAACLVLVSPAMAATPTADRASDNAVPTDGQSPAYSGDVWAGPEGVVLWDNGPLINCPGCGVGGADESILQNLSLGMNIFGFGHQVVNNNRVADDFTVPTGDTWEICAVTFYAYQSFAGNVSTITDVNVELWDGDPNTGTQIPIPTTDTLANTEWSGIYRVLEDTSGINTDRAIMANTVEFTDPIVLTSGTYWWTWQSDGTEPSGPWAPPVTINGQVATGNGLQSIDGAAYTPLLDTDVGTEQDLPFIIEDCSGDVGLDLSISGTCPGSVTLSGSGGTPNGGVGILFSPALGSDPLAAGPCAGTQTELMNPALFSIVPLDGNGDFSITRTAPAGVCGRFLQLIDAAAGCSTSPAQQLP